MKKSPKKFLIKLMMFIFIINIFSVTYAAYQFVKTYVIDNGYLYQNADGMTVKEFKEQNNIPDIQIYNQAGELLNDSDKISTGDTFEQDGEQNTIVLRGDLNGDGSIDENDFITIKEHAIEKNVLQNEYEVSADLDENNEINLIDVLLFKRIKSNQEEVKVEGITLDKSNCNLFVGDEKIISATVLPENASNKNVVWSSSNPEIASVNAEGIITALNPGRTVITATTEDGGYTAECEINVLERKVKSIEIIEEPIKTTYIQNYEELDVTGGKIRLTYNDGTTEEIDMTVEMISGFNNTILGPQTLTVTYEGNTATFEVTIIEKELVRIEIAQQPNKTIYIQNYEELDVTGGKIRLTYNDGTTEEIDMTVEMISGFNNTILGQQTLTVTYEGNTATFEVTIVAKELVSIEIAQQPNKVAYIQNYEELDVTGGKIRLTYNDGTTEEIDMTVEMISGFDNKEVGPQTLTVSYEGKTTTFEVTVLAKALNKIEISQIPDKVTYIQNYEELDVTGGKIKLIYSDATTEEMDMTLGMVTGFDNTELGSKTLTVTYGGKSANFEITIIAKELVSIEIAQKPNKTTYIQNYEELDITGGKIRLIYNDETTEEIDMTEDMVSGFDNATLGSQTLTVTYEGENATFEITIEEKALKKIEIIAEPNKKTYIQNYEELDVTGGKIRLIYNDKTTEEIDMTSEMVSGFDNREVGLQTLTVTYREKTATFGITIVKKELEKIEIIAEPNKKTYIQNSEELDITGGKIRLTYNDETTEEIDMAKEMVTGFDNTEPGPKTLTVTYEGKQATFQVTIIEKELVSIEIAQQPNKKTYIQNYEELDVTGGKIRLIYNDETTEEINMTTGMVTGFSNATLGPKTLTVTYEGKQATFQVTIVAKGLVSIEIAQQPNKTTYIQNHEALDVTGGKIRLIYNDETTEEINMTTGMVSGFNNSTLGPQTLTVTYEGKKATFEITIVEERTARLDKTDIVLNAGEETTLAIITTPDNVEKSYTSRVENSTVAKLEKTGTFGVLKLTGLAKGTTKITFIVTVDGIEIPLECNVTVNAPDIPVTGITLDKTEMTLEKGETGTITATIKPENATNQKFSWSSDNADAINLVSSENGTLTIEALAKGEATIIATTADGNHTASCKVTVTETPTGEISMKLDKTNETIASAETIDITAIMTGMNQNVNWETSNAVIAKITKTQDNTITVTGAQAGKATITATTEDENYTASCEINVVYPVTGVTLTEETETITVGSKTLLTKVLDPINATNQNVTWTSSNQTIATVNENGIVEGIKEGNVTITVATKDGNHQATCEVTVTSKTETPASEFTYQTQYNTINITGYTGSDTEVVIPESIDGKTVEQIGNGYSKVTGFDNVNSVILPNTVTTIGRLAFNGYTNLTNIDLKNVELIDVSAFKETGLTKITLPDTLKTIGSSAFSKCANLASDIIIPDSVTSMGSETFSECTNIKTVKFSKNCSIIPQRAFYKSGLTGPLEFPEGVEIIDAHSFYGTKCTSVKFADSIKYIYRNAFRQCSSKMEVELVLPKNLILWGDAEFDHARNFTNTSIVIPKTVKVIGGDVAPTTYPYEYTEDTTGYGTHTFYDLATYSLKEFVVEEGNEYFQAIDGVLFSKDTKRLVSFPPAKILEDGVYEMPEGVEQIDELSFSLAGYSGFTGNLKTLKLPSTFKVTEFGPDNIMCSESGKDQVCYNTLSVGLYIYNGIKEVIVSEDNPYLKSIDGCVYSKDGSTLWYVPLQKTGTLNIPEGTTTIARGSFAEGYGSCPLALTGLNIPASVVNIEEDTLPWINKLPSRCIITVNENNPYWTVDSSGNVVEK